MTPDEVTASLQHAGIKIGPIIEIVSREAAPLVGFNIAADEAIDMWQRLRDAIPRTELYPVLIADEHNILGDIDGFPSPEEAIAEAAGINAERWLKKRTAESMEHSEPGEWPDDAEPTTEFSAPFDISTGEPRENLAIALLPTDQAWHAAAHLQFAAVNYDIEPQHHTAVHKYWLERHGAEMVACGGDFLEFKVARPPTTREAAMDLARQHYGYCPDIIDQGVESVEALAAILMNAPVWFFWWD